MKLLRLLLKASKGMVALSILLGVISGISSTGLLALTSATLAHKSSTELLVAGFIGLLLIMPLSKAGSEFLLNKLGQKAIFDMRMELSQRILAAPLRHLEELGSHRLWATLTDDIRVVINTIMIIPLLCINMAIEIGCLVYLGWLSPAVLLIMLCFMGVGILSYQMPMKRATRYQKRAREGTDRLFNDFRALTEGTKELKLNQRRRQTFLSDNLQVSARSLQQDNLIATMAFIAAASWGQILYFIFIGGVLFILPRVVVVSAEILTGCILTMLFMRTPLDSILNSLATLVSANVTLKKIEALGLSLSTQEPGAVSPAASDEKCDYTHLELSGVTHKYKQEHDNNTFTLGPVHLSFLPGELVFIAGGNGSGKTTLAKLIAGLYTPESGEIRLNHEPVTSETSAYYMKHISAVFSDFYVFENLRLTNSPELDARANNYLSELQLSHKVQLNNGALSTTALSHGQRKRLALLAAYLEDRPIYIFDEWAADQDPQFKQIFYLRLLPDLKARGKTVIVISHDDQYFHVADRVVRLLNGQLVPEQAGPLSQMAMMARE